MASNHSLPLIAIAISTCTISSWLFFQLTKRATAVNRREKLSWMLLATIVIGFGVWATQFIATLGYRPDLDFSFDRNLTVISAVLGILLVGAPATAAIVSGQTVGAALGGFIAGLGVSAMHRAGMGSIIDLHFHHDMLVMLATALAGSLVFALALIFAIRGRTHIATVLLVLAVCVIHFSATAISTLEVLSPAETDGIGQTMLGGIVGTIAICLLLAAAVFVNSSTRVAEQERQRALMATALDNMSNGLVSINHDGRIELFNRRLVSLFGLAPDDVSIGMRWQSFLSNLAGILGWSDARLSRIIANHKLWFARKETTYLEHALDDGRTISVACRPIGNGGAVLTYDDVTAERLAQREIERLAFQDPLTALPNRRSFQRTLEAILESPASVTLMLIDLDRFKVINDTLGHSAGDELLIEVGKRISKLCNRGEFVARLAGDEFAVIATECPPDDATNLSNAIVSSLGSPFSVEGYAVVSGCSIGIASTAEAGTGAMLVQHADLALYKAKAMGRGMSRHYEQGMQEAASQRLRLEADLRVALLEGQFELAFQPIFRLDDLRLIGFEALIRWVHPEHGVISPSVFIPVAEETGLIRDIGFWVLNESCRQVARWPSDVYVAVNVSPVQLRSDVFPLQLASALTSFDIAPSRLEVELTETALVSDSEQIAASLRSLRKMGIRVAMDDFGTGYSSFAHLRDFALDWIKIDKSFVQIAPTDASAAAVVSSVVHMAKGLGVGTIAEGVETQEQLDFLRQIGCSAAQGYLLARPMSAAEAALASVTATR